MDGSDEDLVDFDEHGKRRKRVDGFVAYNHNPYTQTKLKAAAGGKLSGGSVGGAGGLGGGNRSLASPRAVPKQPPQKAGECAAAPPPSPWTATTGVVSRHPSSRHVTACPAPPPAPRRFANLPPAVRDVKLRYRNRKFLFPLLDQGPNNQFLQLRVALAKAHAMNRTLVLPVWLPHNPKFQHLHPGAPTTPSRDKRLDAISYPFESTFDPEHLAKQGLRTIDLPTFRLLSDGRVELCLAEAKVSHDQELFDSYLRHSGIACDNHTSSTPRDGLSSVRFLGYHS